MSTLRDTFLTGYNRDTSAPYHVRYEAGLQAVADAASEARGGAINYAPDIRNTGSRHSRPDGWSDEEWHKAAIADSGASHTLPGRLYIVQCEWCPEAFAANTKAEAMSMFRDHERAVLTESLTGAAHPPLSTTAAESDTGTHTERESALDEGKRA